MRAAVNIYLDYAASTPVRPEVLECMEPYFTEEFGNPGSIHSLGQRALAAVDRARESIAHHIGARFRELIFTGSATEANNIALRGAVKLAKKSGVEKPHLILSAIEHESVFETAKDLEKEGVEISFLRVSKDGLASAGDLSSLIRPSTAAVSVMHGNNEIGTIEPIGELAAVIRSRKEEKDSPFPLFHTDAAQTLQFLPLNVDELGVDLMTLSAHKIYGPKGIGALYVRQRAESNRGQSETEILPPMITGGGQEFGLRSGTENVPLIAGFEKAVALAGRERNSLSRRLHALRLYLWKALRKTYPELELNGAPFRGHAKGAGSPTTLPHILNLYLPGHEAQFLVARLDLKGVAVSSGSACKARAAVTSRVIRALGYSEDRSRKSIRISFGRMTTKDEVDKVVSIFRKIL